MTKPNEGYPEVKAPPTPPAQPKSTAKRPFGIAAKDLPRPVRAGVAALKRWDDLFDVTDEELAKAVQDFQSIRIGG